MKKYFLLLFLFTSCTPKTLVNIIDTGTTYPATEIYHPFAVIEKDTMDGLQQTLIGNIEIKDKGLTLNCDYNTVLKLAEDKARELGANCLIVTEHRRPDHISTCHRIKADFLRIDNPEEYEQRILWHKKRPLKIKNFKASPEKRPFQAVTFSGINYYSSGNKINGKGLLIIESYFDTELSYFARSEMDKAVLSHEQKHFDISEIYARKFRKKVIEEVSSYVEFMEVHEDMFYKIQKVWNAKQDEYDSEVYADRSLQAKWDEWVSTELESLSDYADREILLAIK